MSNRFNGFSQDEIHKIHSKTAGAQNVKVAKVATRLNVKKLPEKHSVHNNKVAAGASKGIASKPATTTTTATPITMATSHANNNNDISLESNDTIKSLQEAVHFRPLSTQRSVSSDKNASENGSEYLNNNDGPRCGENGHDSDSDRRIFQGISLKDFEQHRKMVEEQNKQKKEMLTKAIEQRIERTAAETKRIAEVKEELGKLDAELAADVAILRKEIETVSLQYANVQKSYQQIESQFLKAKLELHQSLEKKELLQEHLCAIISHNEDRKAKKLSELMEKVGLTPHGEYELLSNDEQK